MAISITFTNLPPHEGFGNSGLRFILGQLNFNDSDSESDNGNKGSNSYKLEYLDSEDEGNDEDCCRANFCKKVAIIFANCSELETIKTNPADYLNEHFKMLKFKLEKGTKSYVTQLKKLKNSSKKIRKVRASLTSNLTELDAIKDVCLNNLKQTRSSIKSEANKLFRLSAPKNRDDESMEEAFALSKDVHALKCKLLSGYQVRYQNGKDKSMSQLAIGNCYNDYKKTNADGQIVPVEKNEAESIFYYESIMEKSLAEIYESNDLPHMLRKFINSNDPIELLKLYAVLDVPKPADYKSDFLSEIKKTPVEERFKRKQISLIVEFLFGLITGKFGCSTNGEQAQIESVFEHLLKDWIIIGYRVSRHVLSFAKACCDWLSKETIDKFQDIIESNFDSDNSDDDDDY